MFDLHAPGFRLGADAVDLVGGPVDEGDPGALVCRVAPLGFVENRDDRRRGVGDAGGEPLVLGLGRIGLVVAGADDIGRDPRRRCDVVNGAHLGDALPVAFLALGQPGLEFVGGVACCFGG
jgi:hypothetical protein